MLGTELVMKKPCSLLAEISPPLRFRAAVLHGFSWRKWANDAQKTRSFFAEESDLELVEQTLEGMIGLRLTLKNQQMVKPPTVRPKKDQSCCF